MSGHKKITEIVNKAMHDSQKASSKVNLESERTSSKINEEEDFPMENMVQSNQVKDVTTKSDECELANKMQHQKESETPSGVPNKE